MAYYGNGDSSGCWIYQGKTDASYGYGPYQRVYRKFKGEPPEGTDIHHSCRGGARGCINPDHMEPMTSSRHRRMHAHERAILTVEQAQEIRRRLVDTLEPTYKMAEGYGVTRFIVERIGAGTYWPDAGGTPLAYSRTCGWCGVDFTTTSRRKRYCCTTHQKWYADRQVYLRKRGTDSTYVRPKKRHIPDPKAAV